MDGDGQSGAGFGTDSIPRGADEVDENMNSDGQAGVGTDDGLGVGHQAPVDLPYSAEYHTPVMVNEVCEVLVTDPGGVYIDGTLGGGGHSNALVERLSLGGRVLAVDRDPEVCACVCVCMVWSGVNVVW